MTHLKNTTIKYSLYSNWKNELLKNINADDIVKAMSWKKWSLQQVDATELVEAMLSVSTVQVHRTDEWPITIVQTTGQ